MSSPTGAVSPDLFRLCLRRWPSGVTVLTMLSPEGPHGMTASAFCSVSIHPPQILVVVDKRWRSHAMLAAAGAFVVNLLGEDQRDVSDLFAGRHGAVEDRFAGLQTVTARSGAPCLVAARAWLDCRLVGAHDAGDHTIYVGEVQAAAVGESDVGSLVYYDGRYRRVGEALDDLAS